MCRHVVVVVVVAWLRLAPGHGRGGRGLGVEEVHARVELAGRVKQPLAAAHEPGRELIFVRFGGRRRASGSHGEGALVERSCASSENAV